MKPLTPASLAARIGQAFDPSHWITLDQGRIDDFAVCTGDAQWIHVDIDRAERESPFGGTIAHGFLTLSLTATTFQDIVLQHVAARQVVNYGLDKVRFVAPVRAGRRVRNRIRIIDVVEKGPGCHLLTTEHTIEIENEPKPALVAISLVYLMD
ncbi:MaoC family dehydratase [Ramlibacter sp. PS4R-6]|uniref:MaoC family dehydratase n=1 Tax=Ramlibacter sp. PS4R-6 TaxID=3133438 RepID=UPI0030A9AFAC